MAASPSGAPEGGWSRDVEACSDGFGIGSVVGAAEVLALKALLVFAHVADTLSFSAAARRLGMPVSTVSRRIAELEAQFGLQLLQRSTRSLRLTAFGSDVLEQARRTAEITETVENIAAGHHREVSGTIRFAAPPSLSDMVLAPIVLAFQKLHERVRFDVLITEQVVDYIADRIDLEIHVGPIDNDTLVVRRLLSFRHQLVASPEYVRRTGAPLHPRDLLTRPVLGFSHSEPKLVWRFEHADGRASEQVVLAPSLAMNDYTGLVVALLAGAGLGDLPPIVQPELLRTGRLMPVMTDWRFPIYDLVLIHPANRHQSRAVRLFKEFAARAIVEMFPDLA